VHLRVDHDYLKLHDASALEVTREEADELVASLQAHFAGDGLEFRVVAPERWYVRVPEGALPTTTPLPDAIGRDVFGMLPAAGEPINWRSAITEAQMMMGTHDVNARREAGKPAINSVWFWGEGAAPASIERASRVYASVRSPVGWGALRRRVRVPAKLANVEAASGAVLVVLDSPTAQVDAGGSSRLARRSASSAPCALSCRPASKTRRHAHAGVPLALVPRAKSLAMPEIHHVPSTKRRSPGCIRGMRPTSARIYAARGSPRSTSSGDVECAAGARTSTRRRRARLLADAIAAREDAHRRRLRRGWSHRVLGRHQGVARF
jgi:hypothetical protein